MHKFTSDGVMKDRVNPRTYHSDGLFHCLEAQIKASVSL